MLNKRSNNWMLKNNISVEYGTLGPNYTGNIIFVGFVWNRILFCTMAKKNNNLSLLEKRRIKKIIKGMK